MAVPSPAGMTTDLQPAQTTREQVVSKWMAAREWEQVAVAVTEGVSAECRENVLLTALRDCQWACVTQVLQQGASLQLREQVMKEAVRHSQWPCVSVLVTLGVSAGHRDTAFMKAARYKQWEVVDRLLALGVSEKERDTALHRAMQHQQWHFVSNLLQAGISQQKRDLALNTALDNQLWQLVAQLLEAGVSQRQRNLATQATVQHGQWHLVSKLVQAGISPEERERAVRAAVVQQQWSCVKDLLKAGVTVKDVVRLKLWDQLPKVVALCDDLTQVEHAVKKAIKHCQWSCVTRLVPLGLSEDLKERVLDEAVEWGHVDCAIEMLRLGVSEEEQQRIVDLLFRHRMGNRVVDLLTEGTLTTVMLGFILHTALSYHERGAFMSIIQLHCVTDRTLSQAMTVAACLCLYDLLHSLIRSTSSGRRVFKQLCLKQHWTGHVPLAMIRTLCEAQETDLALHLAAANHLWDIVLDLYDGDQVKNSTRRLAFSLAIHHGAWFHVILLIQRSGSGRRRHRLAFVCAVRQGEWRVALQLCDQGLDVSHSDIKFAIQTCLNNGHWQFVTEYCGRLGFVARKQTLIKFAIKTCVKENLLNCFLSLSHAPENREPFMYWNGWHVLAVACDTALQAGRCDYVLSLCLDDGDHGNSRYWQRVKNFAVESSIKARKWDLMLELAQDNNAQFSAEHFVLCIQKIVKARACWYKCMPFLNAWCKDTEACLEEISAEWHDKRMNQTSLLVEWCMKKAFGNLALFAALLSGHWFLASQAADELKHAIDRGVIGKAAGFAINRGAVDTAVGLLQYTEVEDLPLDGDDIPVEDMRNLLDKCQEKGLYAWAVHLAVIWELWDVADIALEHCQHQATIDNAVMNAVYSSQWNLIPHHVDKSSLSENNLSTILRYAVREGDTDSTECVKKLLEKVDPASASVAPLTLMKIAVHSRNNKEGKLRLCIRAGLSPYQRQLRPSELDCPMRKALRDFQLPLVRLLYESGACSNRELYELKTDAALRGELEIQGQGEMCRYLDHAASNLLPLQNLCRLTVALCLGCRPGRRDRVDSLPVPWCLKYYLSFADL